MDTSFHSVYVGAKLLPDYYAKRKADNLLCLRRGRELSTFGFR